MDWANIGGGIISGGASSLISGVVGSIFNRNAQKKAQQWQTSEREASQRFQTSEREAQQFYQTSEREAQNQYAEDMYNKYQSPLAMLNQYEDAGLNGKLAMEGGASLGTLSASSGSNGGAPSSGSPGAPSTSAPYMPYDLMTSGFNDMASMIKLVKEAEKTGLDTNVLRERWQKEAKSMDIDIASKELLLSVDYATLGKTKQAILDNLLSDLKTKDMQQKEIYQRFQNLVKEGIIKQNEVDHWKEQFDAALANTNADTNAKNARAFYDETNADFVQTRIDLYDLERAFMQSQIDLNGALKSSYEAIKNLNELDYKIRDANSEDEKDALKQEYNKRAAEALVELGKAEDDLQHDPSMRGKTGAKILNAIKRYKRAVEGK